MAEPEQPPSTEIQAQVVQVKTEDSPFFHISNKRNEYLELNDYIPNFRQSKQRAENEFKQKLKETDKQIQHGSAIQKHHFERRLKH